MAYLFYRSLASALTYIITGIPNADTLLYTLLLYFGIRTPVRGVCCRLGLLPTRSSRRIDRKIENIDGVSHMVSWFHLSWTRPAQLMA